MNILQVHKFFWKKDGASNYMFELSDLLHDSGHRIIPFSTSNPSALKSPYSQYFVPYHDLSGDTKRSLSEKIKAVDAIFYSHEAKLQLEALLANEAKIDIAHLHNIYHHISPSILPVLKKQGIPIVMTLHDYKLISPNYSLFHHNAIHEDDADYWYLKGILNKCTKDSYAKSALACAEMFFHHTVKHYFDLVDVFIAPSAFMRSMCIRHGIPAKKIVHIPHPVTSVPAYSYKEGESVTYVGRLSEEKGLLPLLHAAEYLSHIPFVIVGNGPQEQELKAFVKERKMKNVTFTGFETGKDLARRFTQARLMIVPSIWYENYPLAILEAKAKGKVVLGSDIGGIPELLPKELLFAPGNVQSMVSQISAWHSAPHLTRERMGNRLHKEVLAKNDPADHLKAITTIYKKLQRS